MSIVGGSSLPRPTIEDWFGLPIPPHGETNDVVEPPVIPKGEDNLFTDEVVPPTWEDMFPDNFEDIVMTGENRQSFVDCEKVLMTDDDIMDYDELHGKDLTLTFEQALSQEHKFMKSQSLLSMGNRASKCLLNPRLA